MNRHRTLWTNNPSNPDFYLNWDDVVYCVKMAPYVIEGVREMTYYPLDKEISRPYTISEIAKEYGIKTIKM